MNNLMIELANALRARLDGIGEWLAPLGLRLILFWEFWESGTEKLHGSNWFADIPWADWQVGFPWPFSALPVNLNWAMATWSELIFSILLLLGLFTRFTAFSLIIVTVVATAAVHWPNHWDSLAELWKGYAITAKDSYGNFKLPLLFVIMLLPLLFKGAGKLSLDALLIRFTRAGNPVAQADMTAWGLAALSLGLPLVLLMTTPGAILIALGAGLLIAGRVLRS